MTRGTTSHDTFVVERTYDAPVDRVFGAWADPGAKARWFAGSAGALGTTYELDFRVGGHERNRGGPPGDPSTPTTPNTGTSSPAGASSPPT